jgi:hypothetical protein
MRALILPSILTILSALWLAISRRKAALFPANGRMAVEAYRWLKRQI